MVDLLSTFAKGKIQLNQPSTTMIVLRLTRVGKRKQPSYRMVVQDKRRDPWGPALDTVGSYNPRTKALVVKADAIKDWISKGAQMTAAVNNLLITNKVLEGEKMKATSGDLKTFQTKHAEAKAAKNAPAAPAAEEKPAA
jgi:small subunit ribosomal protein S16